MIAMTEKPAAVVPEVLEVDGQEILSEFAKVMLEWGHYKTASGLRYPTLGEARVTALLSCRRPDRGRNTGPVPDGSLFVAHQVRVLPPAD